jgi:rubredoxin
MKEVLTKKLRCNNCGYEFIPSHALNSQVENPNICPVCHFGPTELPQQAEQPAARLAVQKPFSATDLENQLKTLINKARTNGLASEVIVDVLRSELEFEAELGQGRRLLVQIIDLGFQDAATTPIPFRNNRQTPQNHGSL